jgi:uncharacterized membrane protein
VKTPPQDDRPAPQTAALAPVVERNIRALIEGRRREEKARSTVDRVADAVTRLTGSMRFVLIHAVLYGGWIIWNLPISPFRKFDPSLVGAAAASSIEAIFLSTFILMSRNRMNAQSDKRADLDLQISLLAEHEITRVVSLVSEIAKKPGIEASQDPGLGELKRDVEPEAVMDRLEAESAEQSPPRD